MSKNIKKTREKARLTQEQLTERAGISLDCMRKIEFKINKLELKTIFKLAQALEASFAKFFE